MRAVQRLLAIEGGSIDAVRLRTTMPTRPHLAPPTDPSRTCWFNMDIGRQLSSGTAGAFRYLPGCSPRHPGARVMRHRVGELVGEGGGHIGAGAMTLRVPADPDRRGVMEVVAVAGGAGQRIVRARGNGEIARVGVSGRRDRMEPPVSCAETHWSATPDWLQAGRRLLWESTLCRNRLSAILISSC